jgi:hypothetical protein
MTYTQAYFYYDRELITAVKSGTGSSFTFKY